MKQDWIRVILYGLGGSGADVARLLLDRRDVEIVGAIDTHPARIGKDLGEAVGAGRNVGVTVAYDPAAVLVPIEADVVVHTTDLGLTAAFQQILQAVESRKNVVSNCEELAFPWVRYPELAERLDERARECGVCILGASADPGFVLDTLPVLLTTACQEVRSVTVTRVVAVDPERLDVRERCGIGLALEGFQRAATAGTAGYLGLRESAYVLADSLGWRLDGVVETIEPVVAKRTVKTPYFSVEKGQVAGLRQRVTGSLSERPLIRLELEVSLGAGNPRDEIVIDGRPPIHVVIPGGIQGPAATAAVMANTLPTITWGGAVGMLSMRDLPIAPYRSPRVAALEEALT